MRSTTISLIISLVVLAACTPAEEVELRLPTTHEAPLEHEVHGDAPSAQANLPYATGTMAVTGLSVEYAPGIHGYLARPQDAGAYPGVVMMHEWWGLNDNIKAMARELASHGYVVLAVDLYNGNVATTPAEARQYMGSFNQVEGIENMQAATTYVRNQSTKIASLGWCFGGAQSLQLGLHEQLDATVMYYGQPVTDAAQLSALKQPVLGIFASLDKGIPPAKVEEFSQALDTAGVEHNITIYPDVDHAFANPSGDRFAAEAADDAWKKTIAFLDENLKTANTASAK